MVLMFVLLHKGKEKNRQNSSSDWHYYSNFSLYTVKSYADSNKRVHIKDFKIAHLQIKRLG